MKARQVRVYLDYGHIDIAANPGAPNPVARESVETTSEFIQGRVMKHTKGAQGE